MKQKVVVCYHLYNDYSGSTHVLSQVIKGLVDKGYNVELYTSKTDGFLSDLPDVRYHLFNYKWTQNIIKTSILMLYAQFYMFISTFKYLNQTDVIFYINTICPFGAGIGGWISKKKVVYHVHEKYIKSKVLYKLYEIVYKLSHDKSFYVSNYLKNSYTDKCAGNNVIYNALSTDFEQIASKSTKKVIHKTILMFASLKEYKGVFVFEKLAKELSQYEFELVLNATDEEIENWFPSLGQIKNLKIYSVQKNVHPFYNKAGIVLNLSLPDKWIETFGLTILEAMAYGIPCIAPPVGGPKELITDSYNGFLVDSRDLEKLKVKISYIFESGEYFRLSENAINKSREFKYEDMISQIDENIKTLF